MSRTRQDELLLGEWACLGLLAAAPSHGFAIAARLKPDADVGRIWSLSRALTYRALDNLVSRGLIAAVAEERGKAGGTRTIYAPTAAGRTALSAWLTSPVTHLRDVRSELLLKLVLADVCGVDVTAMLVRQRELFAQLAATIDAQVGDAQVGGHADVVALWRSESSHAALRFLDRLTAG